MNFLPQGLRHAGRIVARSPGYAILVILTFALGIGATTAVFSVVNSVLLKPLEYFEANQLVSIWATVPMGQTTGTARLSQSDLRSLESQAKSFIGLTLYDPDDARLTGLDTPQKVQIARVSSSFFSVMQATPVIGRTFFPSEETPEQDLVCVLSYDRWRSQFGSDTSILGKALTLTDKPYTVVGVLPPGFRPPYDAEILLPLPRSVVARNGMTFETSGILLARLKPRVSLREARAELAILAARRDTANREQERWTYDIRRFQDDIVGDFRGVLWLLLAAVGFLLLLATANVANLVLLRGFVRQKEFAIRAALGGSRLRIVSLFLVESLLLSLVGGALGLMVAYWGVYSFRMLCPANTPRIQEVRIDLAGLCFTFFVSVLAGILCGLVPALRLSKPDLQVALKEAGTGTLAHGPRHRKLRSMFAVVQVALAFILVIGSALMIQSFARLAGVRLGFRTDHMLSMTINLPGAKYDAPAAYAEFNWQLLDRVRRMKGVEDAALTTVPLLQQGVIAQAFVTRDQPPSADRMGRFAEIRRVSHDYFLTLGIQVLRGREFSEAEMVGKSSVAIVNEEFVRRFFREGGAVGERLAMDTSSLNPPQWLDIVGVVADTRATPRHGSFPAVYIPLSQDRRYRTPTLLIHTTSDPKPLAGVISRSIWSLEKDAPITDIKTLNDLYAASVAEPRFRTLLLSFFGGLGLLIAIVGVYAVISHSVTQRAHEIGVRLALGAQAQDVLWLVLRDTMAIALLGILVGVAGSLALTRFLRSFLFEVAPNDPATFVGVGVLLAVAALAASYLPARRGLRVNPVVALRYE